MNDLIKKNNDVVQNKLYLLRIKLSTLSSTLLCLTFGSVHVKCLLYDMDVSKMSIARYGCQKKSSV